MDLSSVVVVEIIPKHGQGPDGASAGFRSPPPFELSNAVLNFSPLLEVTLAPS